MSDVVEVPRPEYPRPQFVRRDWLNLNGEWEFEIDAGDSGLERGLVSRALKDRITVPFCPESKLSGIGCVDFMNAVWYRREIAVPFAWKGRRVLVHFQAVDYEATVWANGVVIGRHRGGFAPFSCTLDGVAEPGETVTLVVRARDSHRGPQPMGKQSTAYRNSGCRYTRTTGIWRTVWMEPVPFAALERPGITPDVSGGRFYVQTPLRGGLPGGSVRATLRDAAGTVARAEARTGGDFTPRLVLDIPEDRLRLWQPGEPHLYGLDLELRDASGTVVDAAESYAGLRGVSIQGKAVGINGRPVFQRLVLDQGYYSDGIMTAPSDDALRRDIELAIEAGFNGARLHQKVFEERFLYHADRLGYLVWGEYGDWGWSTGVPGEPSRPTTVYVTEWLEVLRRDYSHPSIVGWCPLNETADTLGDRMSPLDDVTRALFLATKQADSTRPVLDVSGYSHRVPETDVYDVHDYNQDPVSFRKDHEKPVAETFLYKPRGGSVPCSVPYSGQPYFVSEFGGTWWNPEARPDDDSWGYGERPTSVEAFYERFAGLCRALLENPEIFGYCYTQLTDVFQEQNGIYTFGRERKFDLKRLRSIQEQPAAIERARAGKR